MKHGLCIAVFGLGCMVGSAAHAAVPDCSKQQYNQADHDLGWNAREDQRLFSVPEITYDRPRTPSLGVAVVVVVAPDGRVQCLVNADAETRRELGRTAERRAILDALTDWRFKPFLKDGTPIAAVTNVVVTEKVDFHYHDPMPQGRLYDSVIRLERTGCYGTCPSYAVTIHGDGRVVFEGGPFVDVPGRHSYAIPPGEVAALIERLRSRDVWSMAGRWVAPMTDGPTYEITLSIGGQKRVIHDYLGGYIGMPAAVTEAENDIDAVARTDMWIHLSDEAVTHLQDEHFDFRSQAGADLLARAVNDPHNRNDAAMLRLIELGAPVTGGRDERQSPFFHMSPDLITPALTNHHEALVEPLIARGALLTDGRTDPAKVETAFQSAIGGGRMAPVERLWNILDDGSHPPLVFQDESGFDDGKPVKESPVTLLLSRDYGGDPGWQGLAIAKWLIAQGCDPAAHGADGRHLLEIAAEAGDLEMVKYLLSLGIDPSTPGRFDLPPLASVTDNEDVAMALIEAGSDPWQLQTDDYDFVGFARDHKWARVVAWMEAHRPAGKPVA